MSYSEYLTKLSNGDIAQLLLLAIAECDYYQNNTFFFSDSSYLFIGV